MMKFGLLTAILDGWTFEEIVDIASEMGFKCLEVACWPAGKAERRYPRKPLWFPGVFIGFITITLTAEQ